MNTSCPLDQQYLTLLNNTLKSNLAIMCHAEALQIINTQPRSSCTYVQGDTECLLQNAQSFLKTASINRPVDKHIVICSQQEKQQNKWMDHSLKVNLEHRTGCLTYSQYVEEFPPYHIRMLSWNLSYSPVQRRAKGTQEHIRWYLNLHGAPKWSSRPLVLEFLNPGCCCVF